ncbi:hypothetical protein HGRIS_011523 [Hohenbuehelia grisea]|uniref:Uncharacterized protein n=1 Tax=Hohenbuehelia grisea TaxID=104357 RepID=A0ABR3JVK4_9AGAR
MAWAPALKSLYFLAPKAAASSSDDAFAKAALQYAQSIPSLRFISWANAKSFRIEEGRALPAAKCAGPWWKAQRGVGDWWEHRFRKAENAGEVGEDGEEGEEDDEDDE